MTTYFWNGMELTVRLGSFDYQLPARHSAQIEPECEEVLLPDHIIDVVVVDPVELGDWLSVECDGPEDIPPGLDISVLVNKPGEIMFSKAGRVQDKYALCEWLNRPGILKKIQEDYERDELASERASATHFDNQRD